MGLAVCFFAGTTELVFGDKNSLEEVPGTVLDSATAFFFRGATTLRLGDKNRPDVDAGATRDGVTTLLLTGTA